MAPAILTIFFLTVVLAVVKSQNTTLLSQKTKCNETEIENIGKTVTKLYNCYFNTTDPRTLGTSCDILQTELIDVLQCTANSENEIKNMERNVIVSFKGLEFAKSHWDLKKKTTQTCLNSAVNCVPKNSVFRDILDKRTIPKAAIFDITTEAFKADLAQYKKCSIAILDSTAGCEKIITLTEGLFKIVEDASNAAYIPISSLMTMIGAAVFALYF